MKDLVLVAINAKYIHTNLAVRSLKAQLPQYNVEIIEMSINDSIHRIVQHLLVSESKIIGFSCYIWNMELVLKLAEILKKARPFTKILLGGPEVSFDAGTLLNNHPFLDLIIQGEGENKLRKLLELGSDENNLSQIPGLCYRNQLGEIIENSEEKSIDLDTLNFPYSREEVAKLDNKIIYYETMRGCPFSCSYCLSSASRGLTTLSLERVFKEFDFFIQAGVKQVKLVDRTFNGDMKRAKMIFKYLITHAGNKEKINFHFEMTGDLIDNEMIELLQDAPDGLIQIEIGVQSTEPITLEAIGRKISLTRTEEHVVQLLANKNVHIHLDLIAGLPYETYDIFRESFNRVIALNPDMLQLGFLKCLKGTRIRKEAAIHDYVYTHFQPYEIISNKYISCDELYQLRNIEVLVDRYFNSGIFKHTLRYLFNSELFQSPFDFFEQFSFFWTKQGYYDIGKSKDQLFGLLQDFMESYDNFNLIKEWIKFDFLCQGTLRLPIGMEDTAPVKEWIFDFLKVTAHIERYLGHLGNLPAKKIYTQVKFQYFSREFIHMLTGKPNEETIGKNKSKSLILFTEKNYQIID